MGEKVSIYDIAKYLNISSATVSYVINGVDKVSEKTKKKVLQAVEELGYVPSYTARALSTGKSGLIGVLLPLEDASIAFTQNPFYGEFIGGIEQCLAKYNYDLVISVSKKERSIIDWVKSRGLDGLILLGSCEKNVYEQLASLDVPVVLTDDYGEYASGFHNVRSNDDYGMYIATKYLLNLGHQRIGFIGNPDAYPIDRLRYEGYRKALEEQHCPFHTLYVSDATFDGGYAIGSNILEEKRVSAVLCSGDMLAIGLMKKIREMGCDTPKDLSVIGYDDIMVANVVYPGLTTIHQDVGEKGFRSAQIIIDTLENDRKGNISIQIKPKLVIRNSVKKHQAYKK